MFSWSSWKCILRTIPRQRPAHSCWCIVIVWVVVPVVVVAAILLQRTLYHPHLPTFLSEEISQLSSGRVVLVTGANSGLGYDTVRLLVQGWKCSPDSQDNNIAAAATGGPSMIVMACRNETRCKAARQRILTEKAMCNYDDNNNGTATSHNKTTTATVLLTLTLDLSDRNSVQTFAQKLPDVLNSAVSPPKTETANNVPIDILINNAGVFTRDPSGIIYQQGMDEHILVNHLGHVLLLHYLWPKLIQDKTRIVSISSIAALLPIQTTNHWYQYQHHNHETSLGWSLLPIVTTCFRKLGNRVCPLWIIRIITGMVSYGRSKRANILFAHEIHRRFSHTGISSVASHPGIASTNLWYNGAKIFPTTVSNFLRNNIWISQSSDHGAATQVWAALDDKSVPSGSYVGPRWWFKGSPIWLGPIIRSTANNDDNGSQCRVTTRGVYQPLPHFWPFSTNEGASLWEQSLHALGIEEFGK